MKKIDFLKYLGSKLRRTEDSFGVDESEYENLRNLIKENFRENGLHIIEKIDEDENKSELTIDEFFVDITLALEKSSDNGGGNGFFSIINGDKKITYKTPQFNEDLILFGGSEGLLRIFIMSALQNKNITISFINPTYTSIDNLINSLKSKNLVNEKVLIISEYKTDVTKVNFDFVNITGVENNTIIGDYLHGTFNPDIGTHYVEREPNCIILNDSSFMRNSNFPFKDDMGLLKTEHTCHFYEDKEEMAKVMKELILANEHSHLIDKFLANID